MPDQRAGLGKYGEHLAGEELSRRGYTILARNWRCARGEIDIVARDGDCLALVEVRTRRNSRFGSPEESIGRSKQTRLVALGQTYVRQTGWPGPWRIDIVAIVIGPAGRLERLTVLENAVSG